MDEIDGKTPLADVSGLLIDVQTREQLNAVEFQNITKPIKKYILRKPTEKKAPFTYEWLLKVHAEMFGDVWSWAGKIRQTDKNIGIDAAQVPTALKSLEQGYQHWMISGIPQDELAARLHHRLVWIHPFENGNGRWARLITNIHLKKHELPLILWPEEHLGGATGARSDYLKAIRKADEHNLKPLIALQRRFSR